MQYDNMLHDNMLPALSITLDNVSAQFGRTTIWKNLTATLHGNSIVGIVGRNGRGKSTLLKMMCGILAPHGGSITHHIGDTIIAREELYSVLGFVAPYMAVYDEFTPIEHLRIHADLHGAFFDESSAIAVLERVSLAHRKADRITTFSSGLLQRMKCALAIALHPPLLLLDEPCSTLDEEGYIMVESLIRNHAERGGLVVIATNDQRERSWCNSLIDIEQYIAS
jgi:heme exporter protein A